MPGLFRRREVMLPTLWGWLVIAGLVGGATTLIARHLGSWLAVTEPAAGSAAQPLLVVEGWLDEHELDAAAAYVRQRHLPRLVTSGGPIESFSPFASYAERTAAHLRERLPGVQVDAVATPHTAQDRTYASAVWVRDWAAQQHVPVETVEVYSLGPHARRTRMLYRMAFGDSTRVGIVAGIPYDSDIVHWWTTSEAAKVVLMEAVSLAWTQCCFWPAPRGTHEERWAVPPAPPASAP